MRASSRLVRPARSAVRRRLPGVSVLVALVAHVLLAVPIAQAGAVYPNPPNATPVAWPSSFTTYTSDTGTPITDVEGESGVGGTFDISSGAGTSTSVFLAVSSGAAFFRVRIGSDPVDVSKGGFTNATWLVLLATEDSPGVWTTKAVSGVDGKPVGSAAAPDKVYVGNAPGTGIQAVYQFTDVAPAFDPTNAVGTGVRVVSAGSGQYYLDWQVPVSTLVTASGGAITASTPVRLFFGSSAAANLATINKDYMTGSAVSFNGLATVSLSSPTLDLTQSKSLVSGPNPPAANQTSTYDITVTAHNAGGSNLFSPSVVVTIPAGVSIVSQSTATGSIGALGQTVTWSPGTLAGAGATVTATIRVSVTPGVPAVGTTLTLANAASGSGSDGVTTITGTGTAQTAGPVAAAPHVTSTGVSCPAGPIAYGDVVVCTITVTDVESSGATVPTGSVNLSATLGTTSPSCTLSAATATSASCTATFTATGVGSGSLGGSYPGDGTHASSTGASGSISITTAPLTVTTVAAGKTYGDPNPAFGVTYGGFVNGDDPGDLGGTLSFSTAATGASGAGAYPVTPAGLTSSNYAISFVAANLTVGPAPLTATADGQSRAYGAANPTLTVSYSGFVNGDDPADLTSLPSVSTTATPASPVGTYPITASGGASPNYTIGHAAGTLTIGQVTLTVSVDDAGRAYGAANPAFGVTYSGFVNGDDPGDLGGTLAFATAATPASPVGSYPVSASGLASADYVFAYQPGSLTVGTAPLTVTTVAAGKTYGDPNPAFGVTYGGFVNGDDPGDLGGTLSFSTAATGASGAGAYPVTPAGLTSSNYAISFVAANLTVGPAPLTATADGQSRAYGAANPTLTVSYSGFVNGDDPADLTSLPSVSTTATPASPVGTYPITASGGASPNYTIGHAAGTLTVGQATLTLTPLADAVAAGDPIPTSFAHDLTGFVLGEDASVVSGAPSCSTDATAGSPAGAYTITCTLGTLGAANYDIVIGGTAVFTVGQVTLTVSVDDAGRAYGAANPSFGVTYSGFVNGDGPADLGGTLAFATAATSASPVGSYPVSASGLASADYVFAYQPGSLTVTQATPGIAWSNPPSIEYGTALGASQLDALASVPGTYVYTPASGTILGAGTHTLSVTFTPTDTTNYESVSATVEIEVLPADQTITFPALVDVDEDAGPITLAATASSGLAVSYTASGPCQVVGSTLTTTGPGTCLVTANQPGDANHEAAAPVIHSFDVAAVIDPPPPTSTDGPSIDTDKDTLPAGDEVIVTATGFEPGSTVEVRILPDGDPVNVVADANGTIEVAITIPPGTEPGALQIEATGVDPDGGVLSLTATVTVTIMAAPDTSTADAAAITDPTGSRVWGIVLAVVALLLFAVAVGVHGTTRESPGRN